ncbi:MAG: hypothetical protein H0T47_11430 [Planctomycetaceae bacterium]|nr:hypothetical protein [Planctomycetaceae bacterium]
MLFRPTRDEHSRRLHLIGADMRMTQQRLRPALGICQWFHYLDHDGVEDAVTLLHDLGVKHLRTGISWADYHRPQGREWYGWMMRQLADFDVLLSVWHTPPSLAEGGVCAGPPRRLQDFSDFLWSIHDEFGDCFNDVEFWNEPNNRLKWAFDRFDPDWRKFSEMIAYGAGAAKVLNRTTVLGGMIPVDPSWLRTLKENGALEEIAIVAIHGFPEMWWPDRPNWDWFQHWQGWDEKVEKVAQISGRPIWITETGLATWNFDASEEGLFDLQIAMLERAAIAPVDRVYWYSLIDLDPDRPAIEGFHVDENEYHLGLVRYEGTKKPAWHRFKELTDASIPLTPQDEPSRFA